MVAGVGQTEARIITVTLAPLCTIALRFRESSMRKKLEIFGVEKGREVERSGVLVRQTGSANYRKTPDLLFFPAVARPDAGAESFAAAVGCCGWSGRIGGSEQGRNLLRRLPTSNEQRSSFLWLRSQFHTRIL